MTRKRKTCGAPDMIGKLHCERDADHRGQHWITEDGKRYRWGSRSGRTAEADRGIPQLKLRIPALVTSLLDRLAERWGSTRSQAVVRLVVQATAVEE